MSTPDKQAQEPLLLAESVVKAMYEHGWLKAISRDLAIAYLADIISNSIAAERHVAYEKGRHHNDVAMSDPLRKQVQQLRTQLAATQAEVVAYNRRLSLGGTAQEVKMGREALGSAIAEATKPYVEALKELFKLVESGVLVRDTIHDADPKWYLKAMELTSVLQKAHALLAKEK